MSEHKTYVPARLPLSELVRYGEWHDDAWVRELAKIVSGLDDQIKDSPFQEATTFAQLIESYSRELATEQATNSGLEQDVNELEITQARLQNKVDALRYELDHDWHTLQVVQIKADAMRKVDQITGLKTVVDDLTEKNKKLEAELSHTKDQLNMWTALNKQYS